MKRIQMVKFDFNLAPKEAIKYLQNKGYKLSFDYNEIQKAAHHKSFTVAKITRLDLLHDVFTSLDDSLKTGKHFDDFKKEIVPTLQKKGWWGKQDIINPRTGEVKTIDIGSRRLKNIYDTNMRVSYAQARHKQMRALPLSVYWRYQSALLESTRDKHAAMHGTIKHRDDSWWNTNYPPNGWGCKCKVTARSLKEIEKKGWKIEKGSSSNIASKDWDYNVGDTSKVSQLSKIDLDKSLSTLSTLKSIKKDSYKNLSEKELESKFYKTMGIKEGEIEKKGWKIEKGSSSNIASKDWDYNVGDTSKVSQLSKIDLDKSLSTLSTLKSIKKDSYKNLSEKELESKFYKTMGIKEGEIFIDKVNDPMIIDKSLFLSASGHSKIKKQNRHLYLDEIAKTIKEPHEIYLEFDVGKITGEKRVLKKMFRYLNDDGKQRALLVIFEYLKDKTQGVSAYYVKEATQVNKRRFEKLIYKKED